MGASAARKAARVKRFGKQPPSNATDDRSSTSGTDAAPQTESRSQNPASTDDTSTSLDPDSQDATSPVAAGHSEPSGRKCKEAPRRYICFVGNLPFSTTTESLARHFRAAKPSAVRVRTNKGTGRCRGFAFLEFSSKDALQACLRRYHHSQVRDEDALKDGQAKDAATSGQVGEEAAGEAEGAGAKAGKSTKGWRRINVELTVGGGGNQSEGRKVRLKAKNDRLTKQRKRRAAALAEMPDGKAAADGDAKDNAVQTGEETAEENAGHVHPSRKSRVRT